MATYLNVPKTSGDTLFDFYEQGVNVAEYAGAGHIAVAYYDVLNEYNIRVAVYDDGNVHFVFLSHASIESIDIRLVGGAPSELTRGNAVITPSSYGYYLDLQYTPTNPTFHIDVFNDLQTLLETVGWSTPDAGSGVVVIANAAPMYSPPSTEGVIVYGVARLLDPNQQGGTSRPGGGQGTFDESSDPIPIPPLPTIGAVDSGVINLFRPTVANLNSLATYLWTSPVDVIQNINKLFANPMDYIIALNIFPCNPPASSPRPIKIGSVTTTITMPVLDSQWYDFSCGSIYIPEFWGSSLDYAPNTHISLFLPFIGSVQLNTDEVMNRYLSVRYRLDLLSGNCVALLSIGTNNTQDSSSVYYQYTGQCSVSIPLTSSDFSRIYTAAIGAIGTAISGGVAAAGMSMAAGSATAALVHSTSQAAGSVAKVGNAFARVNATSKGVKGVAAMREELVDAGRSAAIAAQEAAAAPGRISRGIRASRIANTVNNTVGQVMTGKVNVQHSGTISGSSGMLGVKVPYVIVEYPNQSLPNGYQHFAGYPCNMSGTLGDFSGYTECEQVIAEGFWGTDDELAELVEVLKGGVYL